MIEATRYHDFSAGHRVYGHENKCSNLHGHNYRITFFCTSEGLDVVGRVIDFSVIKARLCQWLEDYWDHKFLLWDADDFFADSENEEFLARFGVVYVPFNPTAENIGRYLLDVVGPQQLDGTGVTLWKVQVEETRKCSAIVSKDLPLITGRMLMEEMR